MKRERKWKARSSPSSGDGLWMRRSDGGWPPLGSRMCQSGRSGRRIPAWREERGFGGGHAGQTEV
ncbi:proline-rich receptor-like protein kinase PERK9 [Iris pallida]|uniref:Proline-rich receptor-like protein kinase PERK9 n=1 Tax=Iris pallida TaxID=29817 RepID=A0AAX6GI14_IRIPA|nr:proline-rich receptor-like protein kinase PERK9 [Iris pallida]